MNELTIKKEVEIEGLTKAKKKLIIEKYSEPIQKINDLAKTFPEIKAMEMSPEKVSKAKRFRIDFAKSVKAVENVKSALKEESLKEGKAIQGVFNYVKEKTAELKEEALEIENYYVLIEEEKNKRIQAEREKDLLQYNVDGSTMDLGGMDDTVWLNFVAGTRVNFEAIKKAEEDAENERVEAEKKVQLYRDRKELLLPYWDFMKEDHLSADFGELPEDSFNIMLREVKKTKSDYQLKQEKIQIENERLRIENEKAEKKRKIDADKLQKEREEKTALEKKIADEKALKAAAELKAKNAPDKEKLLNIAQYILDHTEDSMCQAAKTALGNAYYTLKNAAEKL